MKHLKLNNETYFHHLFFAAKVGLTLSLVGTIFLLHAILPICKIPKRWNLVATSNKLRKWNKDTIVRLKK